MRPRRGRARPRRGLRRAIEQPNGARRRRDLHPQHTSGGEPGWIAPTATGALRPPVRPQDRHRRARSSPGVTSPSGRRPTPAARSRPTCSRSTRRRPACGSTTPTPGTVRGVATRPRHPRARRAPWPASTATSTTSAAPAPRSGSARTASAACCTARTSGWNAAFYIDQRGRPRIGDLPLTLRVRQAPGDRRSPTSTRRTSPADGVGFYTQGWGRTAGYARDPGPAQARRARVDQERQGRPQEHASSRPTSRSRAALLIGRGAGARPAEGAPEGHAGAGRAPGSRATRRWRSPATTSLVNDGIVSVHRRPRSCTRARRSASTTTPARC